MADIWLPQSAKKAAAARSQAQTAQMMQQVDMTEKMRYWNKLLREIDRDLFIVKAMDDARYPGLKPGYWHAIMNRGMDFPPTIVVHQGDNGEYLEPDSSLLERLRKGDMWNDRTMRERRLAEERAQRAAEREREREKEERIDRVMEQFKFANSTSISVSKDIPK